MQWLPKHKLKNRPYQIEQELGEGGFGITYKAQNLVLDIPVVIKTPNSRLQRNAKYKKYVDNFIREAKQLAKLGLNPHPNIVRVTDLFEEDGLPCIVMDFIPGQCLYDLVWSKGKLSETQALEYIKQIGSALSVCHSVGIVHRDVHPNNILIHADNGKAVLIDFGISGTTQTSRNTHSGNHVFAPWEQIAYWERQDSKTPQVDIYTLAASLYFLVTGQEPTECLARKYNNSELVEPKQLNPELNDTLNRGILKGLEICPADRPSSMEEWLKLLSYSPSEIVVTHQNKIAKQNRAILGLENKFDGATNDRGVLQKIDFNRDDSVRPTLKRKIPFKMIIGIGLLFGGIAFGSDRLILSQSDNKSPTTENSEVSQVDSLVETLEKQYQEREYQNCYDLAMKKNPLNNSVMSEWIGRCGLELAATKASANSYSEAVEIAEAIPVSASNYSEAKENIDLWSEKILEYATKIYREGKLEDAIEIARVVSSNSSVKNIVPELVYEWKQEQEKHQTIINNAQRLLEQQQWEDAKQEAEKITSDFTFWKKQAQAIINRANLEINTLAVEAQRQGKKPIVEKSATQKPQAEESQAKEKAQQQTEEEPQAEESQAEESQAKDEAQQQTEEEAQAEESQAEESQAKEEPQQQTEEEPQAVEKPAEEEPQQQTEQPQAEEPQTEESQTEESQAKDEAQTEESQTEESPAEESQAEEPQPEATQQTEQSQAEEKPAAPESQEEGKDRQQPEQTPATEKSSQAETQPQETIATPKGSSTEIDSFVCGTSKSGTPATVAETTTGAIEVIEWTPNRSSSTGKSPQAACQQVSDRFNYFFNAGELDNITWNQINDKKVICVSQNANVPCDAKRVLYTLNNGEDPNQALAKLQEMNLEKSEK